MVFPSHVKGNHTLTHWGNRPHRHGLGFSNLFFSRKPLHVKRCFSKSHRQRDPLGILIKCRFSFSDKILGPGQAPRRMWPEMLPDRQYSGYQGHSPPPCPLTPRVLLSPSPPTARLPWPSFWFQNVAATIMSTALPHFYNTLSGSPVPHFSTAWGSGNLGQCHPPNTHWVPTCPTPAPAAFSQVCKSRLRG